MEGVLEVFLPTAEKGEEPLVRLEPEALVGETHIVTGGWHTHDVRAAGPAELVYISRETIRRTIEKDPTVLDNLTKVVQERLRQDQVHNALCRLVGKANEEVIEHRASLAKLHARDGTCICYRELIAIPEPDRDARITDVLHDPADQEMIKIALNETLDDIDTHAVDLSAEASTQA